MRGNYASGMELLLRGHVHQIELSSLVELIVAVLLVAGEEFGTEPIRVRGDSGSNRVGVSRPLRGGNGNKELSSLLARDDHLRGMGTRTQSRVAEASWRPPLDPAVTHIFRTMISMNARVQSST